MELIEICPVCEIPAIKVKKELIPLLVIILSMILPQQKTNGQISQTGKTNPQIYKT
jgi:hypothetical protein